jgi:predicted ArsR family transcriptional regulator
MSTETNTDAGADAGNRGRPRPQDTIERDNRVHQVLIDKGHLTRQQLADELGVKPSIAYMSLFRLRRDGRVQRVAGAGDDAKSHTWEAVAPPTA